MFVQIQGAAMPRAGICCVMPHSIRRPKPMLNLARYYLARMRAPKRSDFLDMGYGIEARARRCRTHWAAHVRSCGEFMQGALKRLTPGGDVALLGAGRLLDAEPQYLLSKFDRLHLFDADPGVLPAWRALCRKSGAGRVEFHLDDLTCAIDEWSEALDATLERSNRESDLAGAIAALPRINAAELRGFRCVISLNLLSQLPIYWRDRVIDRCESRGIRADEHGRFGDALQLALLQEESLAALAASGAERAVIISDTDFFYYAADVAPWQCERALFADPAAALESRYALTASDCWLWHIAPLGVEQKEWGAIHRVAAWEFRLKA
jgi:hypothetical protein